MLRQAFDTELNELKQQLLKMGSLAESMLDRAIRSLADQDVKLAQEVIRDDDLVDEMDLGIEQRCMRLLALQQPMSRDLRIIGTVMKVIADVERVGDYALDIARATIVLADRPYLSDLSPLQQMGGMVADMLREALQALVQEDLELVNQVVDEDDSVDKLWYSTLEQAITTMQERPEAVREMTHLLLVARYLERIADHVTNIVERVAYMATGQFETLAPSHASALRGADGTDLSVAPPPKRAEESGEE